MSLLLMAVVLVALAILILRAHDGLRRPATVVALLLAYGIPALFVAASLFQARDERWLRFALLGVGFSGPAEAALDVEVGGDRDAHGLWLSAFSPPDDGTLRIETSDARTAEAAALRLGRLRREPGATSGAALRDTPVPGLRLVLEDGPRAGLWGRPGDHRALQPLQALPLEQGDVVDTGVGRWTIDLDTGLFGPAAVVRDDEGNVAAIPRRRGTLPIVEVAVPIWRPFTAGAATYPLGAFARQLATTGDPPPGFFFHSRRGWLGLGNRLWLSSPAPAVVVERAGERLALPREMALENGARLHALSPPRGAPREDLRARGVRDRRSFRLLTGRRSLAAIYDTPEINALPWSVLEELSFTTDSDGAALEATAKDAASPLRLHLSMGGWQIIDRSLYFRFTSTKVALESMATFTLPADPDRNARVEWTTPRGRREGRLGQALWLGGEHLAAVQLDVISTPWLLGLFALALAGAKAVAALAAGLSRRGLLLVAPLEALVSLRLLLGYRVWALSPYRDEGYLLALVAWMIVPWSLLAVSVPVRDSDTMERPSLARWAPVAAGFLLSLAWCWRFGGGGLRSSVWVVVHLLVAGVVVARHTGLMGRVLRALSGWLHRPRARRAEITTWLLLGFGPGVFRLFLLLVGFRESIQVGQRFALTLVHVPLGIAIEALYLAWLWRRQRQQGDLRLLDLSPALVILLGTWILPALLVSDLGLALLNVPVFLVALVLVVLTSSARARADGLLGTRRVVIALPVVALAMYLVFAAFPIGARAILAMIPEQATVRLESERNYLRLLDRAYPKRLEEVARRGSEELAVMSAVMRSYTSGPLGGHGYLSSEISPHIRATALREHVPAVFVAGEWGLLGSLGLMLVYVLWSSVGARFVRGRVDDDGFDDQGATAPMAMAAGLAALTLAVPSLYMMLANYRLTLFTGKNAYLLGLDSTADVLETLILVVTAALGAVLVDAPEELS